MVIRCDLMLLMGVQEGLVGIYLFFNLIIFRGQDSFSEGSGCHSGSLSGPEKFLEGPQVLVTKVKNQLGGSNIKGIEVSANELLWIPVQPGHSPGARGRCTGGGDMGRLW